MILCALLLLTSQASQTLLTPSEHLGRPVGGDFTLADWAEVSSYFEHLALISPHVLIEPVGTSEQGRQILRATLSSEANLARLGEVQLANALLADPRGVDAASMQAALDLGVTTVTITCAMHATETASPQFAMEFAHLLATSEEEPWRSARERVIVVLYPTINPDGLDIVSHWYREHVGTPFEATGLIELYQEYTGHDNNRDWFMLTQAETRVVTKELYEVWNPQVHWDVHEQGQRRERFFVPPFRDPLNPNLEARVIAGIDLVGTRALYDLTHAGLSGVATGVSYDMWWVGGNRNVPVRHNIIGLLTEAASVDLGTPLFLPISELRAPRGLGGYAPSNRFPDPWPGGWWRLRDIMDYELAFGRSLLGSLSREPKLFLEGKLAASSAAIESGAQGSPAAFVISSTTPDRAATRRMLGALMAAGVEVQQLNSAVELEGIAFPAGSLVLDLAQPYGPYVRDLFEVQTYPEGDPPYDVAGWALPLLMGVRRVGVDQLPEAGLLGPLAVSSLESVMSPVGGQSLQDGDTWRALIQGLLAGESRGFSSEPGEELTLTRMPRVGVFAPWSTSMSEGWLRWMLDHFELPFETVHSARLQAGELNDNFDVLVLPSVAARTLREGRRAGSAPEKYTGGLGLEGTTAVREFVQAGGTLVAIDSSAHWVVDVFALPLEECGPEDEDFSCPGSVLSTVVGAESLFTRDLPASVEIFFSKSRGWKQEGEHPPLLNSIEALLTYSAPDPLVSGWIQEPDVIAGQGAWMHASYGEGEIHLFGFQPHYRGWSQQGFYLALRAILFAGRTR